QYPEGSFLPALISRLGAASTQPTTEPASAQVEKPMIETREFQLALIAFVSLLAGVVIARKRKRWKRHG
ncbi:MAG TPA: hypothetical protein VIL86_04865, partial [Tepidisphaeraceae bacterium]